MEAMAQLIVKCPECARRELAHSGQEFNDPAGKSKHVLTPARCPSLRVPLLILGARRVLEHLEWDAFHAADGKSEFRRADVTASIAAVAPIKSKLCVMADSP